MEERITAEALRILLNGKRALLCAEELDSTNRTAREWGMNGAPDGAAVFAERQTAGRGRKGRRWESTPGESLMMSVILCPGEIPGGVQTLTLAVAAAVAEAIEKETGASCQIKWPNDLLLDGKKVCGILTELFSQGEGKLFAVVGIGVNTAQKSFPEEIADSAVSLLNVTGCIPDRTRLAAAILNEMDVFISAWRQMGFAAVAPFYRPRMAWIGSRIMISLGETKRFVHLLGITEDGALRCLDENGCEICVISGEVTVRKEKE